MAKSASVASMVLSAQVSVWQDAHDEFCDFGSECTHHTNPYLEN